MDHPDDLRATAERYRRLAKFITDMQALEALAELADEYEALADRLEGKTEAHSGQIDKQDS
jgi:hypothetical protein